MLAVKRALTHHKDEPGIPCTPKNGQTTVCYSRASSRQAVRVSSTLFGTRISTPNPQSQLLFRSYQSSLPTSLIYIVLSTRGCSPWRPVAVMSTTWHEDKLLPKLFTDRREYTRSIQIGRIFPRSLTLSPNNSFSGSDSSINPC